MRDVLVLVQDLLIQDSMYSVGCKSRKIEA